MSPASMYCCTDKARWQRPGAWSRRPKPLQQGHKRQQTVSIHSSSVALVRERTIPTERPPPVGEVSANFFFADTGVSRGQRNESPRPLISVFWTGAATFYSSSSSIDLTRLTGPRSRPTTTQKIWQRLESNPRPLYL